MISRDRYLGSRFLIHRGIKNWKWNQPTSRLSPCIISRAYSRTYRRLPGPRSSRNSVSKWIASQEYFMRATRHSDPMAAWRQEDKDLRYSARRSGRGASRALAHFRTWFAMEARENGGRRRGREKSNPWFATRRRKKLRAGGLRIIV